MGAVPGIRFRGRVDADRRTSDQNHFGMADFKSSAARHFYAERSKWLCLYVIAYFAKSHHLHGLRVATTERYGLPCWAVVGSSGSIDSIEDRDTLYSCCFASSGS